MKTSRREFIRTSGIIAGSVLFTPSAHALIGNLSKPIKIGLIADLHQDIVHTQMFLPNLEMSLLSISKIGYILLYLLFHN